MKIGQFSPHQKYNMIHIYLLILVEIKNNNNPVASEMNFRKITPN